MKKIFLLTLFLWGQLYALEKESTLKFYHHILDALSSKSVVSVYVNQSDYQTIFAQSKHIKLVTNLEEADLVLITDSMVLNEVLELETKPLLFATKYRYLEESKEIIGAFYWSKGRAQLLFISQRLKNRGIQLPSEYIKYMVDML